MLLRPVSPISALLSNTKSKFPAKCIIHSKMGSESKSLVGKKSANYRLANISGFKTDLLEINSNEPKLHVLLIPGNPGVVSFYTEFLESLYELLGGTASVTGISHISQSKKDWESRRLFSLEEQIDHKISFIEQELQDVEVPIILVGHSIGSYISLEVLKRCHKKVTYCVGLYPFLALNTASSTQSFIRRLAMSPALCTAASAIGALFGALPSELTGFLVKIFVGKSWSSSAVEALCTHILKYHTLRNVLYMAMTEFQTLPEKPDLEFIASKRSRIAFLFGLDDHWGPLQFYEEMRKQIPDASLDVEREGHTHAFSCTAAGSTWVAQHVSSLIKNHIQLAKGS
ncbi:lipid droplet-associated hydrolase-like [Salvia splendens]|uniref:lipid droplet-associated hydrolase-like n=1 Tax=Salvia splendens TaxID=180675 RepID=UPI001C27CBD9|nr:lipid droplet-associated hydrolase-like [Salvia splendens]XP_042040125.1 lipid droplet-associated hydrolase-like [Salvia splendens]XP_042040126.1 lipid droplet-associated hydrolase-like [Salvia splendens]